MHWLASEKMIISSITYAVMNIYQLIKNNSNEREKTFVNSIPREFVRKYAILDSPSVRYVTSIRKTALLEYN